MSAMVPPTRVAPVDPNEPLRKRATITVCMFGALSGWLARRREASVWKDLQGNHDVCEHEEKNGHDV